MDIYVSKMIHKSQYCLCDCLKNIYSSHVIHTLFLFTFSKLYKYQWSATTHRTRELYGTYIRQKIMCTNHIYSQSSCKQLNSSMFNNIARVKFKSMKILFYATLLLFYFFLFFFKLFVHFNTYTTIYIIVVF